MKTPVKLKLVDASGKQIVEVKQTETEAPQENQFQSFQNHKTERETRLEKRLDNPKAADASPQQERQAKSQSGQKRSEKTASVSNQVKSRDGSLEFSKKAEPQSPYDRLLPSRTELSELVEAGYQEFLDEEIPKGDRIDINTTEFRYMGYMTSMRKSIELVWNYPIEAAQRGMQGEVGLEFIILKSGETKGIKILKSSGYRILDDSIVEAIKLASPFSPLPEGFGKDKILITGSFRYILNSWMAGH